MKFFLIKFICISLFVSGIESQNCSTNPCLNSGICSNLSISNISNGYNCTCLSAFYGNSCQYCKDQFLLIICSVIIRELLKYFS